MASGILFRILVFTIAAPCLGPALLAQGRAPVTSPQAGIGYQPVSTLTLSPEGKWAAVGGENGGIAAWDLGTGQRMVTDDHGDSVRAIAFSPDGRYLASGSRDRTVHLSTLEPGATPTILRTGWQVEALAWSPDAKFLATGDWSDQVTIWDISSTKISRSLRVGGGGAWAVLWSRDGRTIATGTRNGKIRLWDTQSWKDRSISGHKNAILKLDWSQDGRWMVSGDLEGEMHLQELPSERVLHTWKFYPSAREFAFHPGGKVMAAVDGAGANAKIRFFDLVNGADIGSQKTPGGSLNGLAWMADGAWLLAGGWDGSVRQFNQEGSSPRIWAPLPKWRWELQSVARGSEEPKGYMGEMATGPDQEFCTLKFLVENLTSSPQVIRMEFLRSSRLGDGTKSYYLKDCLWQGKEVFSAFFRNIKDPKHRVSSQAKGEDGSYTVQAWQTPQGGAAWVLTILPGRKAPASLVFLVPKAVANEKLFLAAEDTLPRIDLEPARIAR